MNEIIQTIIQSLQQWSPERGAEIEARALESLRQSASAQLESGPDQDAPVVLAAGGLVWREIQAERQWAVIHRGHHHDWSLPKGKLESGEILSAAARREVREETGCDARLTQFAGLLHYRVKAGPKLVFFWEMEVTQMHPLEPSKEVDRMEWLSPAQAEDRLTYSLEREFLRRWISRQES